jgi:uridylate kinase
MKLAYTRVLLKMSGEQLAGVSGRGFDADVAAFLAKEIAEIIDLGVEVVLIVGGGNYVRGAELFGNGVGRVTADFMGMLSGVMNATAVADVLNTHSVPAYALSTVKVDQVGQSRAWAGRRQLHADCGLRTCGRQHEKARHRRKSRHAYFVVIGARVIACFRVRCRAV